MKQKEDFDPYEPRLKPITKDKKIQVGIGWSSIQGANGQPNFQMPWVVKLMGDKSEYLDTMNFNKKVCHGVVVV